MYVISKVSNCSENGSSLTQNLCYIGKTSVKKLYNVRVSVLLEGAGGFS